jgi:hypothetical protein
MPAIDAIVTWTRPGRTWTNDEVMEVVQTFKKTWEDEFKGPIQETFKRGNGGFPAIFRRLNI